MTELFSSLKKINLLPWREEFKEFQRKQFIFFLGLSATMGILLIIGLHSFFAEQIRQQLDRNAYLNQEIIQADNKIVEIAGLKKDKQQLLARMSVIQRLQANRSNVVKIFDGIVKTVPDGLYFSQITRVKSTLNIQGKAESNIRVSKFMRNIESSNWLTSPVLSVVEADADKSKEQTQEKIAEQGLLFTLDAKQTFIEE